MNTQHSPAAPGRPLGVCDDPVAAAQEWHLFSPGCDHNSLLRELVRNMIDAGATEGRLGFLAPRNSGCLDLKAPKLYALDNGRGFEYSKMAELLGKLRASTSSNRSVGNGNFGIGVKIAGPRLHPAGMNFFSKRADETRFAHVRLQLGQHAPELAVFDNGDVVELLDPGRVPGPIRKLSSGTLVVLGGTSAEHDTTKNPGGLPGGQRWLIRAVNQRWFSLPESFVLRCHEPDKRGVDGVSTCRARGASAVLDDLDPKPLSGSVVVKAPDHPGGAVSATVHYRLLHEGGTRGTSHGRENNGCQISLLFDDECYETHTGDPARRRLRSFGIRYAASRVALFIELDSQWRPNQVRSGLERGTSSLDMELLGAEFARAMPAEVAKAESSCRSKTVKGVSVAGRLLGQLGDLASRAGEERARYRKDPSGSERCSCDELGTPDRSPGTSTGSHSRRAERPAAETQPRTSGSGSGTTPARGVRSRTSPMELVTVEYVGADDLDDPSHLVEFRHETRVALINAEHALLVSTDEFWTQLGDNSPEANDLLDRELKSWRQARLTEFAIHADRVACGDEDHLRAALSPEALAFVVLDELGTRPVLVAALKEAKLLSSAARL